MNNPIWFDDNAYNAGMDAQTHGDDRSQCPYDPEHYPLKFVWWGIGWDDSETESMKHEVDCG